MLAPRAQLSRNRAELDRALTDLCQKGVISRESVLEYCNDPEEVTKLLGGAGAAPAQF